MRRGALGWVILLLAGCNLFDESGVTTLGVPEPHISKGSTTIPPSPTPSSSGAVMSQSTSMERPQKNHRVAPFDLTRQSPERHEGCLPSLVELVSGEGLPKDVGDIVVSTVERHIEEDRQEMEKLVRTELGGCERGNPGWTQEYRCQGWFLGERTSVFCKQYNRMGEYVVNPSVATFNFQGTLQVQELREICGSVCMKTVNRELQAVVPATQLESVKKRFWLEPGKVSFWTGGVVEELFSFSVEATIGTGR